MPIPIKISLAAARTNANLSQQYVADEMEVTRNTISNWETGKKKIGKAQLLMFCSICNFPVDNIFLPY